MVKGLQCGIFADIRNSTLSLDSSSGIEAS